MFSKDSSAVQVLPRVRVAKHGSDGSKRALLIKVINPTLGTIRLRLNTSTYAGEPLWHSRTERTSMLENILVDPLTDTKINAQLVTDLVKDVQASEVCQLEPAEDSFLELGKSSNDEPVEVTSWEATTVLSSSLVSSESSTSSLRLVASLSAVCWFELVVLEAVAENWMHIAIPLALQIEVGGGSWESSLVQPEPARGEVDLVTFDLVVAWKTTAN